MRRQQHYNSGGYKTSIFIDNVPFTFHPWIILINISTNAKEQQICPSVSIQKRALNLVLCPPEWKKRVFFLLFLPIINPKKNGNFIVGSKLRGITSDDMENELKFSNVGVNIATPSS